MLLDIAAKQGEFVYAIYKKYGKEVANNFYSIPTSKIAYEFTRKVCILLELDVSHIIADYTSYHLLEENNIIENDKIKIGDKYMKFDAIVANPPYQLTTDGTSDEPIYHRFMEVSYNLSDKATLITPARFLFNAGKTPKEWNNKILNDKHFKVVWYKSRSQVVFPNVDIKGGVAVTFRDKQQEFGKLGTYTAFLELQKILEKVTFSNSFRAVTNIIYAQNKFSLKVLYKEHPQYEKIIGSNGKERRLTTSIFQLKELFTEESKHKDDLCILGLIKNNRIYRYIPCKYIEQHENTHKYKVIIPKSNGSGALGEALSKPLIGKPLIGYTQSFISIGAFDTYIEAEAAFKYVKTKFARVMLGILKVTQDNSKEVWKFVPLQNFTATSDIDWSQSVADIDRQLYAKYGLSEEEIGFIEGMIKVMG